MPFGGNPNFNNGGGFQRGFNNGGGAYAGGGFGEHNQWDNSNRQMGQQGQQGPPAQFNGRPPARKIWANQVSDHRLFAEASQNTPMTCDEGAAFIHIAVSENLMEDGFAENLRRGKVFTIWVRSSGDRNADHKKARALSEIFRWRPLMFFGINWYNTRPAKRRSGKLNHYRFIKRMLIHCSRPDPVLTLMTARA